jgi:hypothetical protein
MEQRPARRRARHQQAAGSAQATHDPHVGIGIILREHDQRFLMRWLLVIVVLVGVWSFQDEHINRPVDQQPRIRYTPRILINACDWQELCLLPGISRRRAQWIVLDRERNGPFQSSADLQRVFGVGPKTCDRLADHLDFSCVVPNYTMGDKSETRRVE